MHNACEPDNFAFSFPADIPVKLAHPISSLAEPLFKYTVIVQLCSNCTLTFKMGMP